MKPIDFDENELIVMAIFAEKTKQETIETLKEALETLEESVVNPTDDEMIQIVSSLIEKLQQIEDKYFYAIDLDHYLRETEDGDAE